MSEVFDDDGDDRPTYPEDPSTHHPRLAQLIRELKSVAASGASGEEQAKRLDTLLVELRYHFDAEEGAMERARYPLIEEHRDHHAKFITHVEAVCRECSERTTGLIPSVIEQLENWFFDHEQTADAELLSFLRSPR